MNGMTWQQKLAAISAAHEGEGLSVNLRMRKPGDWYVQSSFERGGGDVLLGGCDQEPDPQSAVEHRWEWIINTPPGAWLTTDGGKTCIRWNGYMWERVAQ